MSLNRERIAEIRDEIDTLDSAQLPRAEVLALLDAYEAQRPRPASEPPAHHRDVLGYVGGEWREAAHSGEAWYVYADGDAEETDDLTWWLPLPGVPR